MPIAGFLYCWRSIRELNLTVLDAFYLLTIATSILRLRPDVTEPAFRLLAPAVILFAMNQASRPLKLLTLLAYELFNRATPNRFC